MFGGDSKWPTSANGAKWTSTVNWAYANVVLNVNAGAQTAAEAAHEEVAERLEQQAAIGEHLAAVGGRAKGADE